MVAMGRILDERGRIFGKVNIVDVLVVLVIIAVVVFAVVRFTGTSSTSVPLKVTYTVEAVREATATAIQDTVAVNGTVRDEGGTVLGNVLGMEARPTQMEYLTPEGELKAFDSPIFSDVDIVVRGDGTKSGESWRVGSIPMLVGRKVTLRGGSFEVQSVIMRVVSGEEALK
jgi:hypothetical protein